MSEIQSLKKQVLAFGNERFKEIFEGNTRIYFRSFLNRLSAKSGVLIVIPFTLLFFIGGQYIHPKFLQFISLPKESAMIIIDQRTANLATIFSISLVVIGWLITNLSVKEEISYKMLFKKTYLYPIFYFIISLIACMIVSSLLRHETWFNLSDAVISATYLMLLALVAITFLFFRLITVVGTNFFYTSLETEIMKEVKHTARIEVYDRKSRSLYQKHCEGIGFVDGINFNTDLSHHNGINITPLDGDVPTTGDFLKDLFAYKQKYIIKDIKLDVLSKNAQKIQLSGSNYYRPLSLNSVIVENYYPFYFHQDSGDISKVETKIKRAFKVKAFSKDRPVISSPNLDYLCERFEKDVKEGKKENVEMALAIFSKVFQLENNISKEC